MNKISFIIEFDEVSKTQEEQLTEFIEKTGIKFQVLESDNDLKKYKKYKEVIEKIKTRYCDYYGTTKEINDDYVLRSVLKEILDLLKEVA